MVHLSFGHWLGLIATLAIFVYLTIRAARSVRTAEGYSLGGRKARPSMIAGSILGSCVAGASTIGTAQMAYSYGLCAWWFTFGVGISLIVMALFYARPLRKSGMETLPQFLGRQYGRPASLLASVISSTGILFSMVASTLSGIALATLIFHLAGWEAAGVIGLLVVASVFFGGLKGAGLTGLLKMAAIWFSLMIAGITAAFALGRMPDFAAAFPAAHWFNPFVRGVPTAMASFASLLVGMLCTQTYLQAVFAAENTRAARTGVLLAAAGALPVGLPAVAVGMFMHHAHPEISAIYALPLYLVRYLPGWLGGIGLAGILFSVVGSISGLALGIGTMISRDFGSGVFHIRDGSRILALNRASVLAFTFIAIVIALTAADTQVLDWNYLSMALRGAGVFLPMALAVFWPRHLGGGWAALSMAASTLLAIAGRFVFRLPVNPLFIGLLVSLAVTLAGLAATKTARARRGLHPAE